MQDMEHKPSGNDSFILSGLFHALWIFTTMKKLTKQNLASVIQQRMRFDLTSFGFVSPSSEAESFFTA